MNQVPQKLVVWTLDKSTEAPSEKVNNGNDLLAAIGEYLKNNQEVFLIWVPTNCPTLRRKPNGK